MFDRLVLKTLTHEQITEAAAGKLSLDQLTRSYVHDHLDYRFAVVENGRAALTVERDIQQGALGVSPFLNPR